MPILQERLVEAYAILVMAGRKTIEEVPEFVLSYSIRAEVVIRIAEKEIEALNP